VVSVEPVPESSAREVQALVPPVRAPVGQLELAWLSPPEARAPLAAPVRVAAELGLSERLASLEPVGLERQAETPPEAWMGQTQARLAESVPVQAQSAELARESRAERELGRRAGVGCLGPLGPKVVPCRRAEVAHRLPVPAVRVRRPPARHLLVSRETVRFVAVRTTGN